MKIILKISRYLLIAIAVVLAILMGLSVILQGRITQLFRNEVNKYTETGVDVEKVHFSLLKRFPKATVEFENIRIESPSLIDGKSDSAYYYNNFLEAENIYASFNIRNLLDKKYTIEKLSIKNGSLVLIKDSLGLTVRRIIKDEYRNDSAKISFDLEDIRLENTKFIYLDEASGFIINTFFHPASGKLSLADGRTSIELNSSFDINNLTSRNKAVLKPGLSGDIEGELLISADSINFKQLNLVANNQILRVKGFIDLKEKVMNLNIASENTDLGAIINSFRLNREFSPDIVLEYQNTDLSVDFNDAARSFLASVHSFRTGYAGCDIAGSLYLSNLLNPGVDLKINADIDLGQLNRLHPVRGIKTISGKAHINAALDGRPGRLKAFKTTDLLKLDRSLNIHLSDVDIDHLNYDYPLNNITGNIMIADNIWVDELSFLLSDQNMVMNCKIDDAENIFKDEGEIINITAGIWADKINTGLLAQEGVRKQETGKGKTGSGSRTRSIMDRLSASLSINADSLIIGSFRSSQFDGVINYKPGLLNISSFSLMAFDGSFSGNASAIRKSDGTNGARAWFDIESADINRAFVVFNNFGQEQIVAENIRGRLSGTFSISTLADPGFKPIPSSLSVSGNYTISDGELINFEPALKLSRFIEVSELEDIKFSKLRNDLIIAEQRLLIPLMEINSSAFNISLSGEQDFSGSFEYHLSVLLSDILSRKARNSRSYISEFGPVQDDGLGRTTLFLKLEKDKGETKVSYDVKKLSEEIKVSLQKEKQSLKTILNDEYGWYKNDSLSAKENSSRRFRITWEEADSIKTIDKEPESNKTGIFKKIFKPDTLKKKL